MFVVFLALLCAFTSVRAFAPEHPCKITDLPCITKVSNEVYRSIFQEATNELDPMFHELIEGNLSILKYKLHNSTITGFKDCKTQSTKLELANLFFDIDLICPHFMLTGKYDMKGRIILLPVDGNGEYRIDTRKYSLSLHMELKRTPINDKNYITIKNFKLDAEPLEGITFEFTNLFNGQKDLADAVSKFANENWREVAKEVQGPVFTANIKRIIQVTNKIFKTVPIESFVEL